MQNQVMLLMCALCLFLSIPVQAQYALEDSTSKRYFLGSTFFVLGNLAERNTPDFVQLNLGYRLSSQDVVSLELKTWKYAWSLGIPYGPAREAAPERFPGFIREYGFALVYQRFLWKGLYTRIHVMNAWQSFVDDNGNKVDNGFQLFNTYRLGYHIKLFKGRCFLEPSLAITHRPFHTEMPDGFKQLDDKWSKFFFGEPGLHFGVNL